MIVSFRVLGVPRPQGSKRAFTVKGRTLLVESGGTSFAAWRNAVAETAAAHSTGTPLDGPLRLAVSFRFPMPTSRRKADRQRGWCWKTSAPDTTKLTRLIEDALQAARLVTDDARFVDVHASKWETTGWTGVRISVSTIGTAVARDMEGAA